MTLTEKQAGYTHKNELDLQGLRVQKKSDSRFDLQTTSSMGRGRVYVLDADVRQWTTDDKAHNLHTWIQALEQEAILARRSLSVNLGVSPAAALVISPVTSPRYARRRPREALIISETSIV